MESLGQYVISVSAASVLCGILTGIPGKGTAGNLVKLLCGLFLCFAFLEPICKLELGASSDLAFPESLSAESILLEAEEASRSAQQQHILSASQSYILDKAASMGLDIQVDITLSPQPPYAPESITIRGAVSPYNKARLERMLQNDFGIGKEDQHWTG